MYRNLEPEVAGGLGKDTKIDNTTHPPIVHRLHYEFSGWLGDDILETFPCFIVTEILMKRIQLEKLTGIIFEDVIVSKSQSFIELYPQRQLPKFFWAKITGIFGKEDFFIGKDYRLIISEKAYNILKLFKIENAIVEDIKL